MTRLNDIRPQRRKPWKILARVIIGFKLVSNKRRGGDEIRDRRKLTRKIETKYYSRQIAIVQGR